MHITDNFISKPIKKADGSCAVLKMSFPVFTAEEGCKKRETKNEKRLNGFFDGLVRRMEKKAMSGTCEHYALNCKITYRDSECISMFFEANSRSRGKISSYTPFSATYRFSQSRFCRACEFCRKDDIKNVSKHLPSGNPKYAFYLTDGCITFFEKRNGSNRVAKISIPTETVSEPSEAQSSLSS